MQLYDTHCHVFNARILQEFIARDRQAPQSTRSMASDWWNWICETCSGMYNSAQDNNQFVLDTMSDNFPGASCATMPLMMDISYANSETLMPDSPTPVGESSLSGIRDQIHSLKRLSSKGNCYPFFAVDPRRPGVGYSAVDALTQSPGGFYGIKLYPRLGFHPMSGCLPALYSYCAEKGIPITTHCSTGGFWSVVHSGMCDPENFRPALESNPTLKINFAHWGIGSAKWRVSILDLMHKYPGVYADLSSYGSPGDLSSFKGSFWGDPIVRSRTLYGSDYDMVYLTQGGLTLDAYIKSFQANFNANELTAMMSQVPSEFLQLSS